MCMLVVRFWSLLEKSQEHNLLGDNAKTSVQYYKIVATWPFSYKYTLQRLLEEQEITENLTFQSVSTLQSPLISVLRDQICIS